MSELKPCPFCGNEPVVEGNLVACNNLNCPTHDNYWTDPMIFTCDQWNTRPIEDELRARIAELEGEIAKMKKYFHKPAHGTCCTCQKCGHTYDECRCDFDEALDDLDKANARMAELEADKERLNSCESALISMVNQFFYSKAGENIFRHSFMSAEEEAAEYLVEHGIARWAGKNKSAICFNEAQE